MAKKTTKKPIKKTAKKPAKKTFPPVTKVLDQTAAVRKVFDLKDEATRLLRRAEEISEENGLPFLYVFVTKKQQDFANDDSSSSDYESSDFVWSSC